jgi:multiple sugar transport system permease protein
MVGTAAVQRSPGRRSGRTLETIGTYAVLCAWSVFVLLPLYWLLTLSLKHEVDVFEIPPRLVGFDLTFDNYRAVLGLPVASEVSGTSGAVVSDFMGGFLNSLLIVGVSLIVTTVLGTLAGYAFARHRFIGRDLIAVLLLAARFIPVIALIMPLYVMYRTIGIYNTYLGLVLVYQIIGLPLFIWMVWGHIAAVPPELEDAARVDGCNLFRVFRHVVIPLAAPGIASAAIVAGIYMWNNFFFALLLGASEIQPVTVAILNYRGYDQIYYAKMAAASMIAIAPEVVAGLLIQRYIVKGLSAGAVK